MAYHDQKQFKEGRIYFLLWFLIAGIHSVKHSIPEERHQLESKCSNVWACGRQFSFKPQQQDNSTVKQPFEILGVSIISIFKIALKAHYFLWRSDGSKFRKKILLNLSARINVCVKLYSIIKCLLFFRNLWLLYLQLSPYRQAIDPLWPDPLTSGFLEKLTLEKRKSWGLNFIYLPDSCESGSTLVGHLVPIPSLL